MREWHLTAADPLSMRFAADVRSGRTNYADDQSWEIVFGGAQEPALIVQTRYGGRVGLARLVPMWVLDGKPIYEGADYAGKPVLRAFAPDYARITAQPVGSLAITFELWVMESQAVGGRFTLENTGREPLTLRLELFAQVVREGKAIDMNMLGLDDGSVSLHLGKAGNLNPVLLLEGATPQPAQFGEHVSPKLSAPFTIPAGGKVAARWVHAGQPTTQASLVSAYRWLYKTDWDVAFRQIEELNASTPIIETGNPDWDAAIAFSQQVLLRSFIGPTGHLPHPSFVSARIPSRGFSPRGDGSDHGWQWNGQTAALAYLVLPAVATIAPDLAKGALRNFLAVQQPDGWIDFKPGLGGQRANMLSLPLLATIAEQIFYITEDKDFLAGVMPGLLKFFERWFAPDMDRDRDGFPEWTSLVQTGYTSNPTFVRHQRWAQNADISKAEAPDLAAYLKKEETSLSKIAGLLEQKATADLLDKRRQTLTDAINRTWNESAGSYLCLDRDTHVVPRGQSLFRGKGDEAFDAHPVLDPPNRLILRVIGGKEHQPNLSITVEGTDYQGKPVAETITALFWQYGMGSAVTDHVYKQVNYVKFSGLSRVYSVEIDTVDLTRQNLTLLLPVWATGLYTDVEKPLLHTITDPERYWRTFGMPICPANDPAFSAGDSESNRAVWLFWNSILIEGLYEQGHAEEAGILLRRIVDAQIAALKREHAFREAYNCDTGAGLGDIDDLYGIVPLHLCLQLAGIRIMSSRRVFLDFWHVLPWPVKVTQFGVEVTRSADGATVRFPSGYVKQTTDFGAIIEDPTPPPAPPAVEPEIVPAADSPAAPTETANPEAPAPVPEEATPAPVLDIPVDAKKDDTVEIPIRQIDPVPPPAPDAPGTIRIPVHGPKPEE